MLQKRGSIYYFRWVVPKPYRFLVGQTEIVKSLKTTSRSLATERAARYYWLIRSLKSLFAVIGDNLISQQDAQDELPKGYQKFIQDLMDSVLETNAITGGLHPDFAHYQQTYQDSLKLRELIQQAFLSEKGDLPDRNMTIYEMVVEHFKTVTMDAIGWHFPIDDILASQHGERFKRDLVSIYAEANALYLDKFHPDKVRPTLPPYLSNKFKSQPSEQAAPASLPAASGSQSNFSSASDKLFSVAYKEFLHHKNTRGDGLKPDMAEKYARHYDLWMAIVGDMPLKDIRKATIRNFLLDCCRLPKRNKKPYNSMSLSELLEMEIPAQDLVSTSTVTDTRKWVQGVFSFCVQQELIEVSPAVELNLQVLSNGTKSYAHYNDIEMRKILSAIDQLNDQKGWIVRIAAYSGMRLGEIVGLTGAAIKRDEETGRFCFHITDKYGAKVKTQAGIRIVPIHQAILESGFMDEFGHLIGKEDELLFTYKSNYISRWFVNKLLVDSNIDPENITSNRKVFHSFRHTVVTKLRASNFSDNLIKQVVGHETSSGGITDRYDHGATVAQLLPLIDIIKY